MNVLCHRVSLLEAVNLVSGIAPARSPKPILQNLKLVCSADAGSELLATDLEAGIRCAVMGVKVHQPGEAILPTQRINSILRATTDGELALDADAERLSIKGLHAEFELPTEDPDLFPEVPDFAASSYYVLPSSTLKRLIRRTIFAVDLESTRYALGGVLFAFGPDSLTLVGTDGRRLATAETPVEQEGPSLPQDRPHPVIPAKALKLLERNLADDDSPVHLAIQDTTAALVRTGRAVLYTRLLEGRYPRYQDVFPNEPTSRVIVDVEPLLSVVEQAAIVTDDESRGVDFQFGEGMLRLSSKAAEKGRSRIELPIAFDDKPIEVTFDPRYLIEALKNLDSDMPITIELIDSKTAAVFRTDDGYTYVVMPLTRDR